MTNSDASVPANGEISFFGYLDDTDEEIRLESSIGAGYDAGNWYDDLQNYLTEAPGNPYDYHFYNSVIGEGHVLSKLIPNNSFQQEDIVLVPVSWPDAPESLDGQAISSDKVIIRWTGVAGLTYHVYRRDGTSDGSFFRIDDPTGSLTNPGVSDSLFVDAAVDGISTYDYVILAEDGSGALSPHSAIVEVNSSVIEAPVITAIQPNSGLAAGGTAVTITGSGFDPDGAVATIGGQPLTSVVVVSPFEITGLTPAGSPGPADVVVTNTASDLASAPLVDGFTWLTNDVPVVTDIPDQTIDEGDTFTTINLDDYVSDIDNTDAEMIWTATGNLKLIVDITDRVATITIPDIDWNGTDTITFRATDPGLLFDEDSAVFTVNAVNDAPVVDDIPDRTIDEGATFAVIDLDDYVDDIDNADADISWTATGNIELLVDIADQEATITIPDVDWYGTETIMFTATDPGSLVDSNAAVFTVNAVNDAPTVADIPNQAISEGATFAAINLDDYVSDIDNDDEDMTWFAEGQSELTVTIDEDRIATITIPDIDWNGAETIVFRATDPGLLFGQDASIFVVTAINDAPVVDDIPDQTIDEGDAFAVIDLNEYVDDIDNSDTEISWTATGNIDLTIDITDHEATITIPDVDWNGTETIMFTATDPGKLADSNDAVFTVNAVNDAPVLDSIGDRLVLENGNLNITVTASDVDGADPALTTSSLPDNAGFVDHGDGTGTFDFNPDFTQEGSYPITFYAGDGLETDSELVTITVVESNQPPELDSIGNQAVAENAILNLTITASDPDGTSPELSTSGLPANATFTDNETGSGDFIFHPDFSQAGEYTVTFYANDGLAVDSETITITVTNTNLAPLANAGIDQPDRPVGLEVALNGTLSSDPDDDPLDYHWSQIGGTAVILSDTNIAAPTFTPMVPDAYLFELIVDDGNLFSAPDTVAVAAIGVNAPVLDSIGPQTVAEGGHLSFALSASDADGTIPSLSTSPLPPNASAFDNGDGTGGFEFDPDFTQAGLHSIIFYAADNGDLDSEIVTITVINVNRAPAIDSTGPFSVVEYGVLNFDITASDPDGTSPRLTVESLPSNAVFTEYGDGNAAFTFEPVLGQAGEYYITFRASDEPDEGIDALEDSLTVVITVTDANRPPQLVWPLDEEVVQDHSPTLDWSDAAGADQYEIEVDNSPVFASVDRSMSSTISEKTVSHDLPIGLWYWRVRAHYASGWSDWSVAGSFHICDIPGTPVLVRPVNGSDGVARPVSFDWGDIGGADVYQLTVRGTETIIDTLLTVSSFNLPGLEENTTYFWQVRARNTCDLWSEWSAEWNFTTECPTPKYPTLVGPPNGDTVTLVLLEWNESEGATGYQLAVDNNANFSSPEVLVSLNELSYLAEDLDDTTKYFWRVRAENHCGWGSWGSAWMFITSLPTDVTDIKSPLLPDRFALHQNYPNPFNPATTIEFSLPHSGFVTLDIFDITGRKVKTLVSEPLSAGTKQVVWDGTDADGRPLPSAIYFYRLRMGDLVETRKMILMK